MEGVVQQLAVETTIKRVRKKQEFRVWMTGGTQQVGWQHCQLLQDASLIDCCGQNTKVSTHIYFGSIKHFDITAP